MNTEVTESKVQPLIPRTVEEAMRFSKLLAASTIVPKDFIDKEANIFVAIQWGMELGLHPMQAMQSIAVINGRPSLWGDAGLALVKGSGLCEYFIEEPGADSCSVRTKRRGEEGEQKRTFTKAMAETAHLWGKEGPWKNYPVRMLQMRARWWLLRDVYPDVLRGVTGAEERVDEPIDVTPKAEVEQPQARSETAKPPVVDAEVVTPTPTPAPTHAPEQKKKAAPDDGGFQQPPIEGNGSKPANDAGAASTMGEGQLRIIRAKLKNTALTEADLVAKFGSIADLKFGQFQEIGDWIAEKAKQVTAG